MTTTGSPWTDMTALMALEQPATRLPDLLRLKSLSEQSGFQVARRPGSGMSFAEHRLYQYGDPLRDLDWKVTARRGKPHVRTWHAEHEQPRWILVDQSPAMFFGSVHTTRAAIAAELAALLAWQALGCHDPVALTIPGERNTPIRAVRHRRHLLPRLHQLLRHHLLLNPAADRQSLFAVEPGAVLARSLQAIRQHRAARGSLALITTSSQVTGEVLLALASLRPRLSPLVILIQDPLDLSGPPDPIPVTDGLHTGLWQPKPKDWMTPVHNALRDQGIPHLRLSTERPVLEQLLHLSGGVRP